MLICIIYEIQALNVVPVLVPLMQKVCSFELIIIIGQLVFGVVFLELLSEIKDVKILGATMKNQERRSYYYFILFLTTLNRSSSLIFLLSCFPPTPHT